MEILLRRHAPTAGNLERRYLGRTDQPLCYEGVERARAAAEPGVAVDTVYTSHLQRTVQTARLLYPGARVVEIPHLAEMDFGAFEGKTWAELKDDPGYLAWLDSGQLAACPGGESRQQFVARVRAAFLQLLEQRRAAGALRLVVVAHGGTLMAILSGLAEEEKDYFEWQAPFCGGWLADDGGSAERPLRILKKIEVPA